MCKIHMAQTRIRCFCFFKFICVCVILSQCHTDAAEHFPYQQVADCTENHYFSSSTLQCISCGKYQVQSNDGLSCVCMAGYWHTAESVMAGGPLTCSPCPPNHVSSPDGSDCVRCHPPLQFNPQSRRCSSCPQHSITVEYGHNGSLVDRACVQCDPDSVPDAVGRVCRRCPGTLRRHSHLAVTRATDVCGCPDSLLLLSVSSDVQVCAVPSLLSQIPTDVGMFAVDYGDGTVLDSHFFREYLRPAVYLCRFHHSLSACQLLANLCTLTLYRYGSVAAGGGSSACDQLRQLRGRGVVGPAGGPALHLAPPALYYADDEAVSVLSRTRITQQYTVLPGQQTSYMNLTVARYSWDGRLLSVSPIDGSTSAVLCPQLFSTLSSALRFGARYRRTCRVPLRRLLDSEYRTEFYQLYLYYSGTGTDQARLYSVPVRVVNYRRLDDFPNQSSDRERWQLVHRFFLADVVSGVPASLTTIDGTAGQAGTKRLRIVRYVSHIQLDVEMRTDRGEPGLIYPPLLTLHYSTVNVDKEDATLNVHASAIHTSNMDKSREQIEVAVGVMSAFAAVWAVFRTWAWSNRNGKTDVDAVTLTEFVVCACGGLSNVFLLVSFGTCFYWFVFFKQQSVAFLLLPSEHQQMLIRDLVIAAFFLKMVDIVWLLISQVNVDIFLMDWERPKPRAALPHPLIPAENDRTHMVSIWRTYFIANEWNEIQTLRRVSPTWRLVLTVFCLQVVGLIQLAAWTPDSRIDYSNDPAVDSSTPSPPDAYILRFCVICLVYVTVTAVQLGVNWCVLERFVSDQLQQFVDLCSLANISVLVLSSRQHGFYLHGRSVHGHADADLTTLCQQLQREKQDLCSRRGLVPNSDLQTFQILLPSAFRLHYDNILAPIISQQRRYQGLSAPLMRRMLGGGSGGGVTTGGGGVAVETPLSPSEQDPSVRAYTTINKYLAAFIEHAIKDLDYSVKDKQYIETMFDLEFADSEERGIFYNDPDKSFDRVLLYGNELALSVFELLFFCFVDILSSNLLLSAFVVFCCGKVVAALRYYFGRRNLARKTLVDERFLV